MIFCECLVSLYATSFSCWLTRERGKRNSRGLSPTTPRTALRLRLLNFPHHRAFGERFPNSAAHAASNMREGSLFALRAKKFPHVHALSDSSCRLGLSLRLSLQTTYRLREKPSGGLQSGTEEEPFNRPLLPPFPAERKRRGLRGPSGININVSFVVQPVGFL